MPCFFRHYSSKKRNLQKERKTCIKLTVSTFSKFCAYFSTPIYLAAMRSWLLSCKYCPRGWFVEQVLLYIGELYLGHNFSIAACYSRKRKRLNYLNWWSLYCWLAVPFDNVMALCFICLLYMYAVISKTKCSYFLYVCREKGKSFSSLCFVEFARSQQNPSLPFQLSATCILSWLKSVFLCLTLHFGLPGP